MSEKDLINYNLYEKRHLLEQLKEMPLEEQKNVFQSIIYNQEAKQYRQLYWNDIMLAIYHYYDTNYYNKTEYKKYFFSESSFEVLDKIGLDYNYCDRSGFNFLHFFAHASLSFNSQQKEYVFSNSMIDYIMSKTQNIYHLSHTQENILFHIININTLGIGGEKLSEFSKKYNFNFSQKNIQGLNLVDISLQNHLPMIASRLIHDYHIDYEHENKKGQNILRHFLFLNADKETRSLFDFVSQNLNANIVIEEKGLMDTWLDWARKDANVQHDSKRTCVKWIIYTTRLINDDKLNIDYSHSYIPLLSEKIKCLKDEFLSEYQSSFTTLQSSLDSIISLLDKKYLESKIIEEPNKLGQKFKI